MAGRGGKRRSAVIVVEDEGHERRYERACGIDVAKASGVVCTRLPPEREGGRRASRVETAEATVPAITASATRPGSPPWPGAR